MIRHGLCPPRGYTVLGKAGRAQRFLVAQVTYGCYVLGRQYREGRAVVWARDGGFMDEVGPLMAIRRRWYWRWRTWGKSSGRGHQGWR